MSQYSFVRYTSAGSAGPYNVPFPYRDKADVKAYVDDVEALFSWTTSSSITLNNAPAIGAIVEIKRNTSRSARLVQWSSVNQIDADNLETDSLQAFYISQEAFDAAGEGEQVATAGIEDGAVTNSKLEDMQQNTIKGRVSSGTGDPENLTGTQVAAMLPEFAGSSKGLVPASLNVEGTFLRGDGQWAIPEGSGGGGGGGGATISDGDKGDITVSGSGAVWTIDPNSVTFAKMADMDSGSLIYRRTGGSGDPEAQTLATLKADLGLTGTNSGDQTITLAGDLGGTGTATVTATIQNNAVNLEKMADVASGSVFYRKTSGTGDPEVQSLATLKTDLGLTGTNTGDQTITLTGDVTGAGTGSFASTIANDAVSNAKLANMANATIKGRTTAGTGDPEDLTAAQATALLDTFTSSLNGLAPASGGGTTNFLRADGQWVAPPAGGGGSQNLFETIAVAGNTSVVADATNDTLTLSAGANMAITTDAANDTITFAVTGLGSLAAKSSIENADVAANAAIAHTKLASITSGQVLLGNGSNVPTATAISGDATLASSGAVTIANNAVSFAKMADIPTNNIVGRVTGGTGDPEDLTADEVITLINTASTNTLNFARVAGAAPTSHNQAWSTITSTPTTLSGYGITDALSNSASSTQTGTFGDIKLRDDTSPSHYLTITDAENLTQDVTLSLNMNNGNRTLSLAGNLTASGAATVSGTNTGDQTITLTGDVTGTGTGSFAATVAANAVDMTKLADISVNQVIGRVASGTGDPKALTADEVISVINAAGTNTINTARLQSGGFQAANQTLSNIAAQTTGGFFAFADSGTPTRVMTAGNGISITNGNGNTGNPTFAVATGDYGDITVSASGATWTIDNDAVTYAKIQNVSATNRLLGRATAGAGDIEELDATAGRTVLGLGTMATQNATNVSISGGSATLASITATSGTITTATISGGSISGISDLAVADGGTGASNAADARTNLGLVIGTNVQAYDAELAAIAGLTSAANKLPYFTGSGTAAVTDLTAAGRALIDDADAAAQRQTLGLGAIALRPDIVNADVNASAAIASTKLAFTQAGTGASARTVDAKLKDVVSVFDFMTAAQVASVQAGDLAENVADAIQAAVDAARSVYMPPGTYRIDTKITLSNTGQSLVGAGAGGNSRTNSGTPGVVPTGVSNAATTIVGNFTTGEVIRISAQGCTLSNMCISGSTTLNNRFGQSFDATKPGVLVAGPNTGGYTPTRQTKLANLRVMNQPGDGILMVNDVVSSLVNTCEVHCVKGSGFVVASGRYVSLTNPITPPGQVTFLDCVACWTGAHAFRAGGGTADADLADAPYRIVNINFEGFYNCIITANCVENSTLANAFVTGFNHTFMNCAFDGNTETSVPLQTHAAIYVAGINIEFINQRLVQVTSPAVYARGKFGGATRLSDNITFRSTFAVNSSQGADYFDPLVDVSSVNSITVEVGRHDNTTVEQFKRLTSRPANTFWNEVLGGVSLSSTPINVTCPGAQTGFVSAPSFTLADDQATYFEFDGVVRGTVSMSPNTSAGEGLIAAFRVGSSGYTKSMAVTDAANVNVSTSTGKYVPGTTDGVDGDLNIQADTATNRLYIQNRRGASYSYGCTFMNTSANSPAIGIITGPFQEGAGTSTASATSSATGTTF